MCKGPQESKKGLRGGTSKFARRMVEPGGGGGNGIPPVQRGAGMLTGQRKAKRSGSSGSEDTGQRFREGASPQLDPSGLNSSWEPSPLWGRPQC